MNPTKSPLAEILVLYHLIQPKDRTESHAATRNKAERILRTVQRSFLSNNCTSLETYKTIPSIRVTIVVPEYSCKLFLRTSYTMYMGIHLYI